MILQTEHKHQQTINLQPIPETPVQLPKAKIEQNLHVAQPPSILTHLLANSLQLINEKSKKEIMHMLKHSEQKVMLSYSDEPNLYLTHLIPKGLDNSNQLLKEIIGLQTELFTMKVESGIEKISKKGHIKDLKNDIKDKITQMKRGMMSLSSIQRKASKEYENIMQFRKKSYWMIPSEKNQQLKSFLTKMKRIQSQHKKKYEKSFKERELTVNIQITKQKQLKEQMKKQMFSKQLEKQVLWRKQRLKNIEEEKKKRQEIQAQLKKYNSNKPIYLKKQQEFIKNIVEPMEEQRQKKLEQIKEKHQPLDKQELQDHLQKYTEYKQTLLSQHRKKEEEEKQMETKLQQELKELYHSKFHSEMSPRFYNSAKIQRESIRKRVKEFGTEVTQKYKPEIDPKKRAKVQQKIQQLQLAQNKKKRKVILQDGRVYIEDKPEFDSRKLGVEYLTRLREQNEGKPRKQRSSSLMELETTKVKRIDYLRQNKPNLKLKYTMGEWKKVIDDSSYSPREKYASVMQQVVVMEQKAKQKQQQIRSYKKGDKAMELKEQMDRYYMESVAAKMVILKDVILKQ